MGTQFRTNNIGQRFPQVPYCSQPDALLTGPVPPATYADQEWSTLSDGEKQNLIRSMLEDIGAVHAALRHLIGSMQASPVMEGPDE